MRAQQVAPDGGPQAPRPSDASPAQVRAKLAKVQLHTLLLITVKISHPVPHTHGSSQGVPGESTVSRGDEGGASGCRLGRLNSYKTCVAQALLLDLHFSMLHIITKSNNGGRDLRGDGNAMKADPRATRVVKTCSDGAVPRPIRIPYMYYR